MKISKCLFDSWYDGAQLGLNEFHKKLFELFQLAGENNKAIILYGWPEFFKDSKYL